MDDKQVQCIGNNIHRAGLLIGLSILVLAVAIMISAIFIGSNI